MKAKQHCSECGAKMVEYKHTLNKNVVACLFVIMKNGGVIPFSSFNGAVTYNQRNNFQKLQYWGLVRKVKDEETGERNGSLWALTETGYLFLKGIRSINKSVRTYRGVVVRFEGSKMDITELGYEPYRQREDYAQDARPKYIDDSGQMRMF